MKITSLIKLIIIDYKFNLFDFEIEKQKQKGK